MQYVVNTYIQPVVIRPEGPRGLLGRAARKGHELIQEAIECRVRRQNPGRCYTVADTQRFTGRMHIAYRCEPTRRSGASAAWCVGGEQIVGIAGIPKMGTAGAQEFFDFVGCFLDHTRRPAGLNLAPQLDERLVGIV